MSKELARVLRSAVCTSFIRPIVVKEGCFPQEVAKPRRGEMNYIRVLPAIIFLVTVSPFLPPKKEEKKKELCRHNNWLIANRKTRNDNLCKHLKDIRSEGQPVDEE